MKLVLTGGFVPAEYVLIEEVEGVVYWDDCQIFDMDGHQIAAWAYGEDDLEGWVATATGSPDGFFRNAELRP